jgi:hypothetical protein
MSACNKMEALLREIQHQEKFQRLEEELEGRNIPKFITQALKRDGSISTIHS